MPDKPLLPEAVKAAEAATEYCRDHSSMIFTCDLARIIQSKMAPAKAKAVKAAYGEGWGKALKANIARGKLTGKWLAHDWQNSKARKALKGGGG